jgi:2-polyprenyl-3-methyl-5-hydroxy-6-metoxy-1,4-benzoquinol methylase
MCGWPATSSLFSVLWLHINAKQSQSSKTVVEPAPNSYRIPLMQDSSKEIVLEILALRKPKTLLDAPSGNGWLQKQLSYEAEIDGVDLFETNILGYRSMFNFDLDQGIPLTGLPKYDAVVCCEGLEHFGNPLLFLESAKKRLSDKGFLIITTPNIWYPAARLQFLFRGFFPGFPCLTGRIVRGTHMHIMPWSFPQLYLYLVLAGFTDIELHQEALSQPKHFWEQTVT